MRTVTIIYTSVMCAFVLLIAIGLYVLIFCIIPIYIFDISLREKEMYTESYLISMQVISYPISHILWLFFGWCKDSNAGCDLFFVSYQSAWRALAYWSLMMSCIFCQWVPLIYLLRRFDRIESANK